MLFHILRRSHTEQFSEGCSQIISIAESHQGRDLRDSHLLLSEQFCRLGQSDIADVVTSRLVGEFLELAVEVHTAHAYLLGNHLGSEVGIAEVLVDDLEHPLQQTFIGRLQLRGIYLIDRQLLTSVRRAESVMFTQEVLDGLLQNLHIERLGDEGIGPNLQALEAVLVTRFGR